MHVWHHSHLVGHPSDRLSYGHSPAGWSPASGLSFGRLQLDGSLDNGPQMECCQVAGHQLDCRQVQFVIRWQVTSWIVARFSFLPGDGICRQWVLGGAALEGEGGLS